MTAKIAIELGHTCKNQFVILDCREIIPPTDENLSDLAEKLCTTPVADDLLVLLPSDKADVRLRIFGGDRREAEFCGNGMVYIAAKVGTELQRDKITIESASGIKTAIKLGNQWKVEIGLAINMDDSLAAARQQSLKNIAVYNLLRAGEPHLVVFNPHELEGFHSPIKEFEDFCRPLCDITNIPGGVSITMVFEIKFRSVLIRTFERGARRHTYSCGTGSVSAIAAVFGTPEQNTEFHVCAPGGSHDVIFENNHWFLLATPQRIGAGFLDGDGIYLPLDNLFPYANP
jgi:diaminopimelate epimerase